MLKCAVNHELNHKANILIDAQTSKNPIEQYHKGFDFFSYSRFSTLVSFGSVHHQGVSQNSRIHCKTISNVPVSQYLQVEEIIDLKRKDKKHSI